jgi:hypothetical protein
MQQVKQGQTRLRLLQGRTQSGTLPRRSLRKGLLGHQPILGTLQIGRRSCAGLRRQVAIRRLLGHLPDHNPTRRPHWHARRIGGQIGCAQGRQHLRAGHVQVTQRAEALEHGSELRAPGRIGLRERRAQQTLGAAQAPPAHARLMHELRVVGLAQRVQIGAELAPHLGQHGECERWQWLSRRQRGRTRAPRRVELALRQRKPALGLARSERQHRHVRRDLPRQIEQVGRRAGQQFELDFCDRGRALADLDLPYVQRHFDGGAAAPA